MPTGYTARLNDGRPTTFPEFAMDCARAFGALIEMRDEAPGAPIPERFEPSPFYALMAEEARARIAEIAYWDDAEAQRQALAACVAEGRRIAERNAESVAVRGRYEAMLAQARAWRPPTPDHFELRKFMISQLEESIRFDCWTDTSEPHLLTAAAYRAQELAYARDRAARAVVHQDEEIARAGGHTEWVRALRASLSGATAR